MAWLSTNPDIVVTELEDGAVLLDMEGGVYYSLNDTGREIWRLLDAADGIDDLAGALSPRFDIDGDSALAKASAFVEQLESEGLAVPDGGSATGGAPIVTADASDEQRPFADPVLVKHEEPLHEVSKSPADPQLPLAE
jgi:hypothetical protein